MSPQALPSVPWKKPWDTVKAGSVGKPVIKFQAMQFKIADMAMKIEVSRQMVAHP